MEALSEELQRQHPELGSNPLSAEHLSETLRQIVQFETAKNPLLKPYNLVLLAHVQSLALEQQQEFKQAHADWRLAQEAYDAELAKRSGLKRLWYEARHEPPQEPQSPQDLVEEVRISRHDAPRDEFVAAMKALIDASLLERRVFPMGVDPYYCSFVRVTEIGQQMLNLRSQPEQLPTPQQSGS